MLHAGERLSLPRSKKCRALLGYLAFSAQPQRRERLCNLFWDVADDPRGALRWTLSRLRAALPAGCDVLQADRESVQFLPAGVRVDALDLSSLARGAFAEQSAETLTRVAGLYRGEFLEGLELPDFLDFTAWCVAQREALRRAQVDLLTSLVQRFSREPKSALPWARQLVQTEPFSVQAHQLLLGHLMAAGFADEAKKQYEHAQRQFRQMAAPDAQALQAAWQALRAPPPTQQALPTQQGQPEPLQPAPSQPAPPFSPDAAPAVSTAPPAQGPTSLTEATEHDGVPVPFVGRTRPLGLIRKQLEIARGSATTAALLMTGEPGAGKSRLLERARFEGLHAGFSVLDARAFDLAHGRPFAPWLDALGLSSGELVERAGTGGKAQLFEALIGLVRDAARERGGLLLVFDDVQWLDRDSAEVLHHVLQTYTDHALVVLLAARTGELSDNAPVQQVLRSLSRQRLLRAFDLAPFSRGELVEVLGLQGEGGGAERGIPNLEAILKASAGNPLYALELSRAARAVKVSASPSAAGEHGQAGLGGAAGTDVEPIVLVPTLVQLVRERVSRLSAGANDLLRWAAVLGYACDSARLTALSGLSPLELVDALEELDRHGLLRIDETRRHERYVFGHDVVREAIYSELSHPRRGLMHRKVAQLLQAGARDPETAHEVARHASLGREVDLGVQACVAAGRYALRTCANADAESLARRGLHLAAELDDSARVAASLELLQIMYSARTPDAEEATARVRALAERALDLGLTKPARIGFQMLSYLRWASASMADAHENILQAERVSRSADSEERSQALAHAARCLVLLERNLGQAEAFILEARGVTERSGCNSAAVAFASAMIAAHRGEVAVADAAFAEAEHLARTSGERLSEFGAIEHRVMLALDWATSDPAAPTVGPLVERLVALSHRVRPGAEVAIAAALHALSELYAGGGEEPLARALSALRTADAKYELAFVLTRWAERARVAGALSTAAQLSADALQVAVAVGRVSERVIATATLAEVARQQKDEASGEAYMQSLADIVVPDLSAAARRALQRLRATTA